MAGLTVFAGVALLTLAAPFELARPLVRLPRQSITSLEAAVAAAFAAWAAAILVSRRAPEWRTPLTTPWLLLVAAMAIASAASTVSRLNAFHMTGRLAAALGVYLLAVNALTSRARIVSALVLAVAAGVVVSMLAMLEYSGVPTVLTWLTAFRPGIATVGAQVRAGGPLQYPTIASMYLEVVFAFGLGLLMAEHAKYGTSRRRTVGLLVAALVVIGEAIVLTFTRAGLITMAASLVVVGVADRAARPGRAGTRLLGIVALAIAALSLTSRSSQSMWLRLTSEGQEAWYRATIAAPPTVEMSAGRGARIPVTVTNTGRVMWDSRAVPPILLSYHWLPVNRDGFVAFEGVRTALPSPIAPDESASVDVQVRAPRRPGRYRLEWDLVEEGRLWFSTEPGAVRSMSAAVVGGDGGAGGADGPFISPPRPTVRPRRFVLWQAAARMVRAHPLAGVGPDNFRLAYGSYAGLADADSRTHSNNMYLEILAGGGLLAFAAFAWLVWRVGRCVAALLSAPFAASLPVTAGVAAGVVAIGLHALVDSFLSFAPTYVLFSLTLGCAVACARGAEVPLGAHRI